MRILVAGDEFVRAELFEQALSAWPAIGAVATTRRLETDWPTTPWRDLGDVREAAGDEDAMIEALAGVQVAVTHLAPFSARVLRNAPDLRLIAVSRGGPVNVNLTEATERGIVVCQAPGRNAQAAAEFTVGMMLAAGRQLAESHHRIRDGQWPGEYFRYDESGSELGSAVVGLVGYGAIGRIVARVLAAFGSRVLVYDPYLDDGVAEADGVERSSKLRELLRQVDIVSMHARLTEQTRGLIGRPELEVMKPNAMLVNTARGGLVDTDALTDALDAGSLRAAALDVFDEEPLPVDHRLRRTPNLVLTPHLAGASAQVATRAARICASEVARWVAGERPAHCANPEVYETGATVPRAAGSGPT